jgi:hypothetical protein
MAKKSKEVTPHSHWLCETCQMKDPTDHAGIMDHVRDVHGVETKGLKAGRSMRMHADGDTWFSYIWEWTIKSPKGDIAILNETLSRRSKDDAMRYA